MQLTKETIMKRLSFVMDPEVDCDIVTMGLVRDVTVRDDGSVHVLHTLTSPMCPLGPKIQGDIRGEIVAMGAEKVDVELTFDPPWEPPPDLREMLGL